MNFGKALLRNKEELEGLLTKNKVYSLTKRAEKPEYFSARSHRTPQHLVFSCCDSFVPVETITNAEAEEFIIVRNIANQVTLHDLSTMAIMQSAIDILKVKNIIILGHTQCGGCKAALEGESKGILSHYLSDLERVKERNMEELEGLGDSNEALTRLARLNVLQQVINAAKTPFVQKRWKEKALGLCISGWVYDIQTGIIEDLHVGRDEWVQKEMKKLRLNTF